MTDQKDNRTKVISVKVTPARFKELRELAEFEQLPVSVYCHVVLMKHLNQVHSRDLPLPF